MAEDDTWDRDIKMLKSEFLGKGAYGKIFKEDLNDRYVAVKYFFNNADDDKFKHEIHILEKLQIHYKQGFVRYFGYEQSPNRILFECLEITLFDFSRCENTMYKDKDELCCAVLFSIINALIFLNEKMHMFHMDIKESNIMLRGDQWVLIDFGACFETEADNTIKDRVWPQNIIGTFCYQPWEALLLADNWYKERPPTNISLDTSLDSYCLAVTLFIIITGYFPNGNYDSDIEKIPLMINDVTRCKWKEEEQFKQSKLNGILTKMLDLDQNKRPWNSEILFLLHQI